MTVEMLGEGACTLLEKPVAHGGSCSSISSARSHSVLPRVDQVVASGVRAGRGDLRDDGVACVQGMRAAFRLARAAAPTDANVLIVGENGTGKELMASALHDLSFRAARPFIRINCAAIPGELLESELFGHRRGAFTGATADKKGLLGSPQGGTLLFDEIAEMPLALQVKLLRVLQEREFRPVGGTTQPAGRRARDLCHQRRTRRGGAARRCCARTCCSDSTPSCSRCRRCASARATSPCWPGGSSSEFAERHRRPVSGIEPQALHTLERHPWPGNVRELEHVIERAVILCIGSDIGLEDLPDTVRHPMTLPRHGTMPIGQSLEEIERLAIVQTLERTHGNKRAAAAMLGIHRPTLYNKLRRYGLWHAEPVTATDGEK